MNKKLVDRVQACVDDPTWSDHAKVPKALLRQVLASNAQSIAELQRQLDECRVLLNEASKARLTRCGTE